MGVGGWGGGAGAEVKKAEMRIPGSGNNRNKRSMTKYPDLLQAREPLNFDTNDRPGFLTAG